MEWELAYEFKFDNRIVRYGIDGAGPDIVVVHGTPWSSYNMRHLIGGLSKNFRVHYFDMMGYGQSDMEEGDVSLGFQTKLLNALINLWCLDNPIIVGHDFGGAVTLRCHLLKQIKFSKIVLIDPVAVAPWGSPFFKHVKNHYEAFAGVPDYMQEAMVKAYIQTAMHNPLPYNVVSNTIKPWLSEKGKKAFYRQIAQADQRFTDEVQSSYGKINTQTLILWGEEDTWIPIEKGYELSMLIDGSILKIIPNAGHLVIEEKPNELLEEINSFLEIPILSLSKKSNGRLLG